MRDSEINSQHSEKTNAQLSKIAKASSEELDKNISSYAAKFTHKINEIYIPATSESTAFTIYLNDETHPHKVLLFRAFNAGFHRIFKVTVNGHANQKVYRVISLFWLFVKTVNFTDVMQTNVIKAFETYRVDTGIKPQSTGATFVINLLRNALNLKEFTKNLKTWEFEYLIDLTHTRLAKHDDPEPVNLNHWFSSHSWLRRHDVGIGNELYKRLASPKALITSFRITAVTALKIIQDSRKSLIELFQMTNSDIVSIEKTRIDFSDPNKYQSYINKCHLDFFKNLRTAINNKNFILNKEIETAIELVVYSNVQKDHQTRALDYIYKRNDDLKTGIFIYSTKVPPPIFHIAFLVRLEKSIKDITSNITPICHAEEILFSWLMAYQTVQRSDIFKLKLTDFNFLSQRNGKVNFIECDYFKGRASAYHQVNTLSTNNDLGKVILNYIRDTTDLKLESTTLVPPQPSSFIYGHQALIPRLLMMFELRSLRCILKRNLEREKATSLFYEAFSTLIKNGFSKRLLIDSIECETPVRHNLFGLSAIKTSSVYAMADKYDPTTLMNYNSHKDETENASYRVESNENWNNICGRVTRTVMRDLATNVFRPSESDRAVFENEFNNAIHFLHARSRDILTKLKNVTGKDNGSVNDLGIISSSVTYDNDLADNIYIEESPHTVMKLKHYIEEVKIKHKQLRECSGEFFFNTVLPTTEWIELLFLEKLFNPEVMKEGLSLYEKYKSILPPHFTHKIY